MNAPPLPTVRLSTSATDERAVSPTNSAHNERPGTSGGEGVVLVGTVRQLDGLIAHLLGERCQPVIAMAPALGSDAPPFPPAAVRGVVGVEPSIYILDGGVLDGLVDVLGADLALAGGGVRVWWPGLTVSSESREHPLVLSGVFEEFALRFDLSRPRVLATVRMLEEMHSLAERHAEYSDSRREEHERARHKAEAERDHERARADTAEAQLRVAAGREGAAAPTGR